jgi:hypothetical protein
MNTLQDKYFEEEIGFPFYDSMRIRCESIDMTKHKKLPAFKRVDFYGFVHTNAGGFVGFARKVDVHYSKNHLEPVDRKTMDGLWWYKIKEKCMLWNFDESRPKKDGKKQKVEFRTLEAAMAQVEKPTNHIQKPWH